MPSRKFTEMDSQGVRHILSDLFQLNLGFILCFSVLLTSSCLLSDVTFH